MKAKLFQWMGCFYTLSKPRYLHSTPHWDRNRTFAYESPIGYWPLVADFIQSKCSLKSFCYSLVTSLYIYYNDKCTQGSYRKLGNHFKSYCFITDYFRWLVLTPSKKPWLRHPLQNKSVRCGGRMIQEI